MKLRFDPRRTRSYTKRVLLSHELPELPEECYDSPKPIASSHRRSAPLR